MYRSVVMQFLKDELSAGRHSESLQSLLSWEKLPDADFFERVQLLSDTGAIRHPVINYIQGMSNAIPTFEIRWDLEVIPLGEIYVEKLVKRSMSDLELSGHNLSRFAREYAPKYSEYSNSFRGSKLPTIIVTQSA